MLHRLLVGIGLGVALLAAQSLSIANVPAAEDASMVGKPAPAFELADSKGAPVKLANFKGRVVLLNFWATWCHGCQLEIPWFIDFQKKYKTQGLSVIGVSLDDDGWKSVNPWIAEKKVNYTIVIGTDKLAKKYGLGDGMPMTVLIDRHGKIAASYTGVVGRDACDAKLHELLENRPARR